MTDGETSGEVLVREGGSVTAIETESLDEPIAIDLDHNEGPHLGVPGYAWVSYEGDVEPADRDVLPDEELASDGGFVRDRVSMRQYGLGLEGEPRTAAFGIMALAYAASGYLWAVSSSAAALVTFAVAGLTTYVLAFRDDE